MIEQASGLGSTALEAVADLERRVLAADEGRLKLEWGYCVAARTDEVRDLLWWEGGQLLGFLGIYGFRPGRFEVTGMVAPEARRRGIGRALFAAALPILTRTARAPVDGRAAAVACRWRARPLIGHDL